MGDVGAGGPILLVDDEPVLREATRQLIVRALPSVTVMAFSNGADALAAARRRRPCIAVLDVDMVPMTGPELAAGLREQWPALPIMFITGTSQQQMASLFEQLGAVACLRKPVRGTELIETIQAHWLSDDA